jgi:hypothetical protein
MVGEVPLTVYDTKYNTVYTYATKYLISRYRITSDIVTEVSINYYDDAGNLYTRIAIPTNYVKGVTTALLRVEESTRPPITIPEQPVAKPPITIPEQPSKPSKPSRPEHQPILVPV